MNKQLHARLAELEKQLIQQAEALRQKDTQLRLLEDALVVHFRIRARGGGPVTAIPTATFFVNF
ncbi:hypothetical protein ZQ65_23715 [Salmonella enterica subsp. enterica serovar Newport]|uniref:Uncharacterized protein n=1 Tax=Salmonella newport TaxID=108619 RepID=A0A5U9KY92_SALNE|nr:hypothetical protein [Salmonella enterica subsp. diarizonae]EBS2696218.1 hypothetical protein [Salmonella enterica subsp. enterica serovar Newport]EBW9463771.1 hypothetical protein [Salmonella enterica subsp. enterica serovar Panama]EGE5597170.1 hypothetical protein [Salmonella enterica subsp. enterica serovar Adelaide]EGN5728423.1 hypothetical protein [Salmonella enterica]